MLGICNDPLIYLGMVMLMSIPCLFNTLRVRKRQWKTVIKQGIGKKQTSWNSWTECIIRSPISRCHQSNPPCVLSLNQMIHKSEITFKKKKKTHYCWWFNTSALTLSVEGFRDRYCLSPCAFGFDKLDGLYSDLLPTCFLGLNRMEAKQGKQTQNTGRFFS